MSEETNREIAWSIVSSIDDVLLKYWEPKLALKKPGSFSAELADVISSKLEAGLVKSKTPPICHEAARRIEELEDALRNLAECCPFADSGGWKIEQNKAFAVLTSTESK